MNQHQAGVTDLLFATHPMSSERYQTSVSQATNDYRQYEWPAPVSGAVHGQHRRPEKDQRAIKLMQDGEGAMSKEQYSQAEGLFKQALAQAPDDYTGLLLMAKCQLVQKRMRKPSDTSNRPSASIRKRPRPITSAASPRSATKSTTRPTKIFPFTIGVFPAIPIRCSTRGSPGGHGEGRTGCPGIQRLPEAGSAGKTGPVCVSAAQGVGLHQIVPIGPCHLAAQLCVLAIWKSSTVRCTASGFQIGCGLDLNHNLTWLGGNDPGNGFRTQILFLYRFQ
jgi:hypothetical protein